MTTRITIILEKEERRALDELARRELRDVRQQALLIIRRELKRLSSLAADDCNLDNNPSEIEREKSHES